MAEVEEGYVGTLARFEAADVRSAEAARAFDGGHAESVINGDGRSTVSEAVQQQGLAHFGEHVRTIVGGAAINAQSDWRTCFEQSERGGESGAQPHIGGG